MMSTVHEPPSGRYVQYTKGAPDQILQCCAFYAAEEGILPLSEEKREQILAQNSRMAEQALRVLAVATKTYRQLPPSFSPGDLETDLVYIGLTGMIDPVRPEILPAIEKCRSAGIRPVMITGDHKDTAMAIARQLGILTDESQAITGAELDEITDAALESEIVKYSVYARVQPEHKVRIVNAWKQKGMITAMTGDGVNDAPGSQGSGHRRRHGQLPVPT